MATTQFNHRIFAYLTFLVTAGMFVASRNTLTPIRNCVSLNMFLVSA